MCPLKMFDFLGYCDCDEGKYCGDYPEPSTGMVGAEQSTYDNESPIGRHMSFVLQKAKMNGWTLPMSYGLRSPVSLGFGMAVAIMESAGPVL